mgnify:CR=1 FL=1
MRPEDDISRLGRSSEVSDQQSGWTSPDPGLTRRGLLRPVGRGSSGLSCSRRIHGACCRNRSRAMGRPCVANRPLHNQRSQAPEILTGGDGVVGAKQLRRLASETIGEPDVVDEIRRSRIESDGGSPTDSEMLPQDDIETQTLLELRAQTKTFNHAPDC